MRAKAGSVGVDTVRRKGRKARGWGTDDVLVLEAFEDVHLVHDVLLLALDSLLEHDFDSTDSIA